MTHGYVAIKFVVQREDSDGLQIAAQKVVPRVRERSFFKRGLPCVSPRPS